MSDSKVTDSIAVPDGARSGAGLLLRAFWMLIGNGIVLLLFVHIAHTPPWTLTALDIGFWFGVAALLAARSADVLWLHGRTADGEPATPRDLRRYGIGLVTLALLCWAGAHSVHL